MQDGMFRHPGDTGSEELIQATAFGGLNTVGSVVNLPYSDAHRLLNVDVTSGAELKKRKGTKVLMEETLTTNSVNYSRIVSTSNLNFLVAKVANSIRILSANNDKISLLTTFSNVWPTLHEEGPTTILSTNEAEQRFIFLGKNIVPVHVKIVERTSAVTTNAASFSVTDARFSTGTIGTDFFAYINTNLVPTANISWNNTTKTATINQSVAPGDVVTFIFFFWQWWAEAELYNTNRFFDAKTRFRVNDVDRSIALSEEIQDNCERDTYGLYRIYTSLNSPNTDGWYIRRTDPITFIEYKPSNGSLNQVHNNAAEAAVDGTQSTLFGEKGTGNPALVFNTRIRKLSHNGGEGLSISNAYVEINNFTSTTVISQVFTKAYDNTKEYGFLLFNSADWEDPDPSRVASNPQINPGSGVGSGLANDITSGQSRFPKPVASNYSGRASHIAFGNARRRGLPSSSVVRIVNRTPVWVGSNGLNTNDAYTSGTWFPVYGLGQFANYKTGTFPSTGVIYQSRLVLSGFPERPMDLAVSAVTDYSWPGELYNDFTIDAFTTNPSNAFDIALQGGSSDRVRALVVYQGSLFAASNDRLYRAFSRGSFTSDSFLIQFVGNTGVLNEQCVSAGEQSAFILSKTGVFSIVPSDGLDDSYNLQNVSFKISNLFEIENISQLRKLSSLNYDATTRKLYAIIPRYFDGKRTRVLVYSTDVGAWSEYESINGFQILDTTQYSDNNGTERFLLVNRTLENTIQLLRTEFEYPVDFAKIIPGNQNPSIVPLPTQSITTSTAQRYQHRLVVSYLTNVQDLDVYLNGRKLTFGTEWVKQLTDTVMLLFTPTPGQTLLLVYKNPTKRFGSNRVYGYETVRKNLQQVFRDENLYSINETTGVFTLSGNANDSFIVGTVYPTEYASPVFSYGVLKQNKRFYNWNGLFSIKAFDDVFSSTTPGDIVDGVAKINTDANLSIVYNNEREGSIDQDLFRLSELLYDFYNFDELNGPLRTPEYTNISVPLQGVGYSVQSVIWSVDDDAWQLSAYQVEGRRQSGRRRITGE